MKIKSPPVQWVELKQYKLENLYNDFKIAEFERTINDSHVLKILDSINNNRFYDNVIRVAKLKNGTWLVMDAQHRLKALHHAYKTLGLTHYDLMLAVYPLDYARLIYRKINLGKSLKPADHLKAMDDKKTPFFTELKPWLTHDPRPDKLPYMAMLQALAYARKSRPLTQQDLDDFIPSITEKEVKQCAVMLAACSRHTPTVIHGKIYKSAIFRTVFRILIERNISEDDTISILKFASTNKRIYDVHHWRKNTTLNEVYALLLENLEDILK